MSVALPPTDICPSCTNAPVQIPGPAGAAGAAGANGTNGLNAYTTTTAPFFMPAVGVAVTIDVVASGWASVLQYVFISSAGLMQVTATPTATTMIVVNTGATGNAAPAILIGTSQSVSPSGPPGPTGPASVSTLNSLSPTTTRGDLIVDDGANSPAASDVRLPVGADGTRVMADSTQAAGMRYAKVDLTDSTQIANPRWPVPSVDEQVARFDGVTGKTQNTPVTINDSGDIQTVGGNARGAHAVDLQTQRANANQVASAANGVISGGTSNRARGLNSAVAGGLTNDAEGVGSFCAGVNGHAIADYSITFGLDGLGTIYGGVHQCSGMFTARGDNAVATYIARNATVDATPTELFLDGVALRAGPVGGIAPWFGSSLIIEVLVVGRADNGDTAAWRFIGCVKNDGGVISDVGAFTSALLGADAGCAATWGQLANVTVAGDPGVGSIKIEVTGLAATNIRWVAGCRVVVVAF